MTTEPHFASCDYCGDDVDDEEPFSIFHGEAIVHGKCRAAWLDLRSDVDPRLGERSVG